MKRIILALFCCFFPMMASASTVDELFRKANDPVAGNPHGNVTIVEFFDYQCGYCIQAAPIVTDIMQSNKQVRVVFKDYPIRGPVSEIAARAALAAKKQNKYYVFSHALLTAGRSLTDGSIFDIAKEVGLNVSKLKQDMESSSISNQLKSNMQLAESIGITGTPAFFIGPTNAQTEKQIVGVLGMMSKSEMQNAINKAGK